MKNIGAAITSQTLELAPANGKLYALRDVTATVDSIPLIAASVLSKKIATGANIIILDVKYGSGAFMKTIEEAQELSRTMVEVGKRLNKSVTAVITSMDQPLGNTIGHSLEVIEAIQTMKGQGPEDLKELCLHLGAIALVKACLANDINEAKSILGKHLEDGTAFEKFREIVKAQGGESEVVEDIDKMLKAQYIFEVRSGKNGFVNKLNAFEIAKACKLLGAGREKKGDKIDHSVGIILNKKIGDKVVTGEILAKIHANSVKTEINVINLVSQAYEISDEIPQKQQLIHQLLD